MERGGWLRSPVFICEKGNGRLVLRGLWRARMRRLPSTAGGDRCVLLLLSFLFLLPLARPCSGSGDPYDFDWSFRRTSGDVFREFGNSQPLLCTDGKVLGPIVHPTFGRGLVHVMGRCPRGDGIGTDKIFFYAWDTQLTYDLGVGASSPPPLYGFTGFALESAPLDQVLIMGGQVPPAGGECFPVSLCELSAELLACPISTRVGLTRFLSSSFFGCTAAQEHTSTHHRRIHGRLSTQLTRS
jgi:hypothetical protein